ncbi:SEC14-like protein 3 [Trichonephila clavipes]|nr:SEC14-like protein 3 [Trichonephila clavipes]
MPLSRKVPSFQDLTEYEKSVVEELRRRTFHDLIPKMQEDETVFYRFCKARDYDLEKAEIMLRKHITWAKEVKIETFLTSYKPPEVFSKYFPCGFLCHDKEGNVVTYIDVGNIDVKGFWNSAKPLDILQTFILCLQKDLMQLKLQNKELGTTLTKIGYIFNLENLSFINAVHKNTIELLLRHFKTYLDNYPERMKYAYILNAKPYINFAISIFKPMFSSAVLEKLKFYGSSGWKEDLLKIIDADELPAFLGGNKTDPDGNPLCKTFVSKEDLLSKFQ